MPPLLLLLPLTSKSCNNNFATLMFLSNAFVLSSAIKVAKTRNESLHWVGYTRWKEYEWYHLRLNILNKKNIYIITIQIYIRWSTLSTFSVYLNRLNGMQLEVKKFIEMTSGKKNLFPTLFMIFSHSSYLIMCVILCAIEWIGVVSIFIYL